MKKCNEKRNCFAKKDGMCTVLNSTYPAGKCKFCKPEREITKGKRYEYNPDYLVEKGASS